MAVAAIKALKDRNFEISPLAADRRRRLFSEEESCPNTSHGQSVAVYWFSAPNPCNLASYRQQKKKAAPKKKAPKKKAAAKKK